MQPNNQEKPQIFISANEENWSELVVDVVGRSVRETISTQGICNLMLTGGNTAPRLYAHWAKTSSLPMDHMHFFFGDERCVDPDHADSNYALVMKTLLPNGVPSGCTIERMRTENIDREVAALAYEKTLPEEIDILLLSMGTDGHVASLFPNSTALRSGQRRVVNVAGPKSSHERLTITPNVIASAKKVFLLVTGAEKGKVLSNALKSPKDFMSLPVCLTMNGTWLLDSEAGSQLR